jgi:ABC-type phosphate/phosphonate transport system substrate-binding protein
MRRWLWRGVIAAAAALVFCTVATARRAEAAEPSVKIGLIGSLFHDTPEPIVQIAMRPFRALMEAQTGVSGQIAVVGDPDDLGKQLKEDKVQLAVFHGVEFAWARLKQPELKPLVIAVNERPFLRAVLVVLKGGKVATCSDLPGKAVALARLSKEHCRLYLERRCVPPGVAADKCFSEVTSPTSPEDALDDLVDGAVQAAVVDAVELEAYQKSKPGRAAKVKALQQSEPFPCAVIAYNPATVNQSLLKRFRDGMIDAKSNPKAKQFFDMARITGFEAVPADYEDMLTEIAKQYPPPGGK